MVTAAADQSPARSLTKALVQCSHRRTLELLTGCTQEEIEASFPSIDFLNHCVREGNRVRLIEKSAFANTRLRGSVVPGRNSSASTTEQQAAAFQAALAGAFVGSTEIVDQAIRSGADITRSEASGRNILHYCVTGGHHLLLGKIVKKLRKSNAPGGVVDVGEIFNQRDSRGWTPLAVAICRGHAEAAGALLDLPEVAEVIADGKGGWNDGKKFVSYYTMEHSCPPTNGWSRTKSNMLHLAGIVANAPMIQRLQGVIPLEAPDSQQRNLFHYLAATITVDKFPTNPAKPTSEAGGQGGGQGGGSEGGSGAGSASGKAAEVLLSGAKDLSSLLQQNDVSQRSPVFCAASYGNTELLLQFLTYLKANSAKPHLHGENSPPSSKVTMRSKATDRVTVSDDCSARDEVSSDSVPSPSSPLASAPRSCCCNSSGATGAKPSSRCGYSLARQLIRSTDTWNVSALQAAFLRKHFALLDRLAADWATLRCVDCDPPSLHEAVCAAYNLQLDFQADTQATLSLEKASQSLDGWKRWLQADLSSSERICFDLIRNTLTEVDEASLMRAIRRCSPDLCYQTLTRCTAKSRPEFFLTLANVVQELYGEREASAATEAIDAPPPAAESPSRTRHHSIGSTTRATASGAASHRSSPAMKSSLSFYDRMAAKSPSKITTPSTARGSPTTTSFEDKAPRPPRLKLAPNDLWNDEKIPSFAAPTLSMKLRSQQSITARSTSTRL